MAETPSRTERKKAKARAEIISAALGLFEEQGYEATTVAQIMDRADYGLGTFYNYFPGKQELVREAVADRLAAARGELLQVMAGDAPAVEKLRGVVLSAGGIMDGDRALFSLYFETFRARQLGVVGGARARLRRHVRRPHRRGPGRRRHPCRCARPPRG